MSSVKITVVVSIITKYSWEIYLTQTLIMPLFESWIKPVGLIVALGTIIVSSKVLKVISQGLDQCLDSIDVRINKGSN